MRRPGRDRHAAAQAAHEPRLPARRAVPAHDRGGEHRLQPQAARLAQGPHPRRASRSCWRSSGSTAWAAAAPRSSPAARSSAPRSPARWPPSPAVLLLDEPLSALDLKLRQHMQLELRAIQRTLGSTFVYVTHDQTEALVMSDRIAIMNAGRIEQVGTPREIYTRPASVFASDFIGETNLVQGTVSEPGRRAGHAGGRAGHAPGRSVRRRPSGGGPRRRCPCGRSRSGSARGGGARGRCPADAGRRLPGRGQGDRLPRQPRARRRRITPDGVVAWADLREDEADGPGPWATG